MPNPWEDFARQLGFRRRMSPAQLQTQFQSHSEPQPLHLQDEQQSPENSETKT